MAGSLGTLHYFDHNLEVHRVVVGPYANNVFVVRCKHTGDAVLIDAANEHERLLELCQALGVRRVLETHGHWDHIQAVPAMREAGYEVAVTALDAPRLVDVGYDVFLDDDLGGPLEIALYSAALFTLTEGRAYSAAEYRGWLAAHGF